MIHPSKLLPAHQQRHKDSCIAWGLELVLKMHNAIGPEIYLLQSGPEPCGYGFGERERRLLKDYGVDSQEHHFDWEGFRDFSHKEVSRASYPIFTLPLMRYVDLNRMEVATASHAFVACDISDEMVALTMNYEPPGLIRIENLGKLFKMCQLIEPKSDFHVLSHG